jgi:hypothetical protein
LTYLGYFDIPAGSTTSYCDSRAYNSGGIAYRASTNSIFVTSHDYCSGNGGIAEFTVPTDLSGNQSPTLVHSRWGLAPDAPYKRHILGLRWDAAHDRLCYTQAMWYNVSGADMPDIGCIHSTGDYSTQTVDGPYEVGSNNLIAGGIGIQPDGKFLIGAAIAQGLAGSNVGPSAYEVDLSGSPPSAPGPATELMTHRVPHTREVMHDGTLWHDGLTDHSAEVIGGTFLSYLREGERKFYGVGCPAAGDGSTFVEKFGFTPMSCAKGYHNDHYVPYLYLYRMSDLDLVRNGSLAATNVHPYEYVNLQNLGPPWQERSGDSDVDYVNHRIFLVGGASPQKGPRIYVFGY